MCIGCGICEAVAGKDSVEMTSFANGNERPIANDQLSKKTMAKITQVCPGTNLAGLPASIVGHEANHDLVWGVYEEIFLCHAQDPTVRHQASTGGLLTALALFLLETKRVDFILHASPNPSNPAGGRAHVSRNRDQLLEGSGSRYGTTATLKGINKIVEGAISNNERFAFVGTPCDVSALRNLAEIDQGVQQCCELMMTMVCGGFMAPPAMRGKLAEFGIAINEVKSIRYRGFGCPGDTVVELANGHTHSMTYLEFWGDDESSWHLPPRCKICPDGIGDAADIAASDTWPGGAPSAEVAADDLGTNAAIVRTPKAAEIMRAAIAAGYVMRGDDLQADDMNRLQPHQEHKKRAAHARLMALRDIGQLVPKTSGLRLQNLADVNTDKFNQEEDQGTLTRVEAGKFFETNE